MSKSENPLITLVLIAKAPRPGHVKTRLHTSFSHRQASDIYQQFLSRARALAERWQQNCPDIRLFLAYDPPDQPEFWNHWHAWKRLPQSSGTLGDRLLAVIDAITLAPADAVIFIGADAPELSLQHLDWAAENLLANHAVVVPALDGGYVLIGIHSSSRVLLTNIPWGTDKVFSKTQEIARAAGLTLAQSLPISDVDTADDLAGLVARLLCSSHESDRAMALALMSITNG